MLGLSMLVLAFASILVVRVAYAGHHASSGASLRLPGSMRFMQTHDALLRAALKKADTETLVQLDKEAGVDYVICAKHDPAHGSSPAIGQGHSRAHLSISAPASSFIPSATVTFSGEDDRTAVFRKLTLPKTFVSSRCSFGAHQIIYGEVTGVEKVSGSPPAIRVAVAWASPQQVCASFAITSCVCCLIWCDSQAAIPNSC